MQARRTTTLLTRLPAQRTPEGKEGIGKHWFANTYFYTKLREDGKYTYKNVKRWTKKIDIFECDKMIIPINVRMYGGMYVYSLSMHVCIWVCTYNPYQCTYVYGNMEPTC